MTQRGMRISFVLIHGGAHGGWCYRTVARVLRDRGHDVYTPTLTGFGERAHVETASLTMEDHAAEVADLIRLEDLDEVVLVGHSLGGAVIAPVAQVVPERIRRVVWLAGLVLGDGESIMTHYMTPSDAIRRAIESDDPDLFVEAFMQDGTPEQKAWLKSRLGPTTMAALTYEGDLTGFRALGLATGYVTALRDQALPPTLTREFAARLGESRHLEVDAGHDLMITKPFDTASALEAMAD